MKRFSLFILLLVLFEIKYSNAQVVDMHYSEHSWMVTGIAMNDTAKTLKSFMGGDCDLFYLDDGTYAQYCRDVDEYRFLGKWHISKSKFIVETKDQVMEYTIIEKSDTRMLLEIHIGPNKVVLTCTRQSK